MSSDNTFDPGKKNPLTMLMTEAFDSLMRSVMVCLPGKIVSFDSSTQLARVQCGINRIINGEGKAIPILENVPVHFSGDGEWYFWHQINPGTEGLILFSQRAIDLWIERGSSITPQDTRMFSPEDAFFIPGFRPNPKKIPGFKNSGVGMSNYSASDFIHITPGLVEINTTTLRITATSTEHNGDVTHQGNLQRTGNTDTTGNLNNNGKDVGSTHRHDGVTPGGGTSGEPI